MAVIDNILNEQLDLIRLDVEMINRIKKISNDYKKELEDKIKKIKINAEVFIGGSIAKETLVKKDKYDVDIFIRFDKKYKDEEISEILRRILENDAKKIHGSRDYFQTEIDGINIEIIPVKRINSPKEAENVTDLSYFHVKYLLEKIKKNNRIADEIKLAKIFCYAQDCYGAESYIKGFSGYSIELLICHYGNFLEFIKDVTRSKDKIIIDDSKFFKNKDNILRELNEAKILSPIILIDPTFKERNALAGLSDETFRKFKASCIDFLKNPSHEFFKRKNIYEDLKKRYQELQTIKIKSNKQIGDIAGTKSKKFSRFFINELEKEFVIIEDEFYYDEKNNISYIYLVTNKKSDEIKKGPPTSFIENFNEFKKVHPDFYIKNKISYVKIKHELNFQEFLKNFIKKDKKIMDEMGIIEVKLEK